MGLSSAARMVASASSSVTPYANVSGMFPIGAQPTAIGGTMSPVWPNGLRARGSAAVVAMGGSSRCEKRQPEDAIRAIQTRQWPKQTATLGDVLAGVVK